MITVSLIDRNDRFHRLQVDVPLIVFLTKNRLSNAGEPDDLSIVGLTWNSIAPVFRSTNLRKVSCYPSYT